MLYFKFNLSDNTIMKVINQSHIDDLTISVILQDLGIESSDIILVVMNDSELKARGACAKLDATSYLVRLRDESTTLRTLAHELKHLEQHVSGLSEWMKASRALDSYKTRWHEIEAREYASKY